MVDTEEGWQKEAHRERERQRETEERDREGTTEAQRCTLSSSSQTAHALFEGSMESDPSAEDGSRPERAGGRDAASEEADPRGFHELSFLEENGAAEAEQELDEAHVGPEFDSYEDLAGDKLRLLDR